MVYTKEDFQTRVGNVEKKQGSLLRRGYTAQVDKNGIIVAKPKARRLRLPIRGFALMVLGFFVFKALVLSANGPDAYTDRLASLQNGTVIEAVGARILAIDPVTQLLANQLGPLFR